MGLRNKKTGEIIAYGDISVGTRGTQGHHPFESYSSLSKLNEEWEDYKPTEPLIKDEEVISFISLLERFDRKLSKLCGEEK